MADAVKDDWLDDLESPEEQDSELGQSDIDALLAGDQGAAAGGPAPGEEEGMELGQSDIDSLLAGVGDGGGIDSGDLDQADIDSLLGSPNAGPRDPGATDPDQDEIDKLFADVDSGGGGGTADLSPFPAEEIDFKDVFDTTDSATQTGPPDFDAEEFKLDADIPDIPDTTGFDLEGSDIFKDDATVATPPPPAEPPPPVEAPAAAAPATPAKRWEIGKNRKLLYGIGAGLAVLLVGTGAFLFKGAPKPTHKEAEAPPVVAHPAKEEAKAPPPAEAPSPAPLAQEENSAPVVNDLDLTIPPESSQLAITLCAIDPESAPLTYEFQSMPEHGQLSGHAPHLIYIPTPGYSGPDGFTVRATDGKKYSAPALVKINRLPPATAKTVAALPETPLAPALPAAQEGKSVPVASAAGQQGRAVVKKRGKRRKNLAPVISVQPLAPVYATGDTVVMNASRTKDDHRDTLSFRWEQVAGVPVVLRPLNSEGSQVSFVAPATFNTVANPTLVFQVTATDKDGARASKDLAVTTKSRRHSAVWQGHHE